MPPKPSLYSAIEDRRARLNKVALSLGIHSPADWYSVTNKAVLKVGGGGLLAFYGNSLRKALVELLPEVSWDPERFKFKTRDYWSSDETRRKTLIEIGLKLGIQPGQYEKWYKVNTFDILRHRGGRVLLALNGSSVSTLISTVFKEHTWDLLLFSTKPRNYWTKPEHQRRFVVELGHRLKIKEGDFDSWYGVSSGDFIRNGGVGLLDHFNDNVSKLLREVFPEHPWDDTKFLFKQRHHWSNLKNHRETLLQVGKSLGIKEGTYDPWYKVTFASVKKHFGGSGLLAANENSMMSLLTAAFPEHEWVASKFANKPKNYWSDIENQKAFGRNVERSIGMKEGDLEGWYKVSTKDLVKLGGSALRTLYPTVPDLVASLYPEHEWKLWKFRNLQKKSWGRHHIQLVLKDIAETFNVQDLDQWYRVSSNSLHDIDLYGFVKSAGGLPSMLKRVYPDHLWEDGRFVVPLRRTKRPNNKIRVMSIE